MFKRRLFAGLVVVLLVGIVSGCSLGIFGGGGISPPSWIRGTWADEDGLYEFKFTSNNITQYSLGRLMIDFSSDVYTVKQKTKNNSEYAVDLTSPSGTSTYDFKKIDSDSLTAKVGISGGPSMTSTLYKE